MEKNNIIKGQYGIPIIAPSTSWKEWRRRLDKGSEKILKVLEPVGKAFVKGIAGLGSNYGTSSVPYVPRTVEELKREEESLKIRELQVEKAMPYLSPSNHVVAWTLGSFNPKVGQLKIAEWGPTAQLISYGVDMMGFKYAPKGVKATTRGTKAVVSRAVKNSKAKEVSKTIDKVVDEGFKPRLSSDENLYRTTTNKEVSALKSGRFEVHPNGGNHGVYGWRRGEPFYQPGSMVESKMVGKRNGLIGIKDPTYLVAPIKEDLQVRIGSGGKYSEPVPATEIESGTHAYYHPSGGLAYDNSSIGFLPGDRLPSGIVAWFKKNGKWLFEPIEQPKQIYRARVYKGGDITDPYSNFVTTDRRYASQYGPTTSYIFESKNPAFAREPMMGYRDPVSQDMFIYSNTKANPTADAIIGHDAVTGEFPYTSLGVEILNLNPRNLTRVTNQRRVRTPFIKKPLFGFGGFPYEGKITIGDIQGFIDNDIIPRLKAQGHQVESYKPNIRSADFLNDIFDLKMRGENGGAWFSPATNEVTLRGPLENQDFGLVVHEAGGHGIRYNMQPDYKPVSREIINKYLTNPEDPTVQEPLLNSHFGREVFNDFEVNTLGDAYPEVAGYFENFTNRFSGKKLSPEAMAKRILDELGAVNTQFRAKLSENGKLTGKALDKKIQETPEGVILRMEIEQGYTSMGILERISKITGVSMDELNFYNPASLQNLVKKFPELKTIADKVKYAMTHVAVGAGVMYGLNQYGMVELKKKGGKTHKPFEHRSILDNGWQSTKLLKNKKNVYGK